MSIDLYNKDIGKIGWELETHVKKVRSKDIGGMKTQSLKCGRVSVNVNQL
jgi:hypothetical protein